MSAQIERGAIAAEAIGKHFTTVFNGAIRDRRISWKTKGILTWLLSHREGFTFSVKAIVAAGPDGEAAVRSALKELENFGYLTVKERPRDNGKITGNVYRVTDMPDGLPRIDRYLGEISDEQQARQPEEKNSWSEPESENLNVAPTCGFSSEEKDVPPYGGFPHVVDPHVVDRAHKKTTSEGDHVSLRDTPEETHTGYASETALPGGESEPPRRPSIEEMTGPGAAVAFEGRSGVPQQPTGERTFEELLARMKDGTWN